MLLLTVSGEVHIKGSWTRRAFQKRLAANLRAGLAKAGGGRVERLWWNRLTITDADEEAAVDAARHTFGVQRIERVAVIDFDDLLDLTRRVAEAAADRVAGRTFAVRVKRRGRHSWNSMDAMRSIGAALLPEAAGVDLDNPEVEIRLEVTDDRAYLVDETWPGPDGLPLGTQDRALVLLSGGFDSVVAAWMLMRRGCPVDMLHFKLDCAQSDHAAAVGHQLWQRWGHDSRTTLHVVDFQPAKDSLQRAVAPRVRQVVLKQLMVEAAGQVARDLDIPALVTGEAVGQVSSQTLTHLAAIDRATDMPVLRPLLGMTKQEIMDLARRVGTYELSARAREVCDLSEGRPVAVAASSAELDAAHELLTPGTVAAALGGREAVDISEWRPGVPLPRAG